MNICMESLKDMSFFFTIKRHSAMYVDVCKLKDLTTCIKTLFIQKVPY